MARESINLTVFESTVSYYHHQITTNYYFLTRRKNCIKKMSSYLWWFFKVQWKCIYVLSNASLFVLSRSSSLSLWDKSGFFKSIEVNFSLIDLVVPPVWTLALTGSCSLSSLFLMVSHTTLTMNENSVFPLILDLKTPSCLFSCVPYNTLYQYWGYSIFS